MASRKENLKALFTNTRSRVIIIFTVILLLVAVIIGVVRFIMSTTTPGVTTSANVATTPRGIQSIPGSMNPTAQYAALLQEKNVQQATEAAQKGSSAIPTIIRTQQFGQGVEAIGPQRGEGGVGFATLARQEMTGAQKSLWLQTLKERSCSKASVEQVVSQGASLSDLKEICSCVQLKDNGYALSELKSVCSCRELKASGFNVRQLKEVGFTATQLRRCGFDACESRNAGFTAQEMADGGFTAGELKGAGFTPEEITRASGLPFGITADDVRKADCSVEALRKLRAAGVTAAAIRRISGCTTAQLRAAGFDAGDLKNAGFTAADLKQAGFTPSDMRGAGYGAKDLINAGFSPNDLAQAQFAPEAIQAAGTQLPAGITSAMAKEGDCSEITLQALHAAGVSAATVKQALGCSAEQMRAAGYEVDALRGADLTAAELKNAGFSPNELKNAGFSAKELADAGFGAQQLKNVGFTPEQLREAGFASSDLKNAGFNAEQLKAAGFGPKELKNGGFSADELREAGYSANALKEAGFSATQLKNAGFSNTELQNAGFEDSEIPGLTEVAKTTPASAVTTIPSFGGAAPQTSATAVSNAEQLQEILKRQQGQMADQRYQQKLQQRTSLILNYSNQSLQAWKTIPIQVYTAASKSGDRENAGQVLRQGTTVTSVGEQTTVIKTQGKQVIKTGDVLFAVIDTSINSDEPGPILATIVSGKLKGAKLIGSFTLPSNANKMVISFNTLSIPGAEKTVSVSAYAIDPNTARTALSSSTNHHYLQRYGSLFASSFLEGFGNAFQSANTTVTIGGTGGVTDTTVESGIGRSALENAVIGLATVGKNWGQVAQQQFNRPTTVEVCSGTGVGVLFTQDVTLG